MPWVKRDSNNNITSETRHKNLDTTEWLEENDAELISYRTPAEPTNDEIYDNTLGRNKVIKALIKSLNDGSFVPGSNYPSPRIKQIIKPNMSE